MRELAWHERQIVALIVGGIPAFVIGYVFGLYGYDIGGHKADLAAVLLRGGYCAVIPVIVAGLAPRSWLLPSLAYLAGFSFGITNVSAVADGVRVLPELFLTSINALTGEHPPAHRRLPSHTDLPWMIGIALWLAGLTSILRRRRRFAATIRRS